MYGKCAKINNSEEFFLAITMGTKNHHLFCSIRRDMQRRVKDIGIDRPIGRKAALDIQLMVNTEQQGDGALK
jgi:hypothetical protein